MKEYRSGLLSAEATVFPAASTFSEMTLPACWDMLQPRLWPSTKPDRSTEAITTEEGWELMLDTKNIVGDLHGTPRLLSPKTNSFWKERLPNYDYQIYQREKMSR